MTPTDQDAATDIEMMLPWHAAGTLDRRDAQRVEEALARDPELARRYALVREELGETIGLNENLGAPSARIMSALFARIDAEPQRRAAAAPGFGARLAAVIAAQPPRPQAYAGAAAAIAILLQAGIIGGIMLRQPGATYETASAPGAPGTAGAFALIRFTPQASQDDVTRFLTANRLSIVAGPMNGGLYRVMIAAEKLPAAELAARIQQLQDGRIIGFIAAAP